jgi:GT2 family glycosyltransferase
MISIVVPSWNNHEVLSECLAFIEANSVLEHEVVIVDNGSTPPVEGAVVRNEENKGFPVAVNQGIRASKGDIIILLNDDVIVTPEWDKRLVAHLGNNSIVGPMTNCAAGIQKISIGSYNDGISLNEQSTKYSIENDGDTIDVNFIIGFCMVFKRSLFDEIGDFDESLWPCSGEEVDFAFRAIEKGHKIAVAKDCYVHHVGSATLNRMHRDGQLNYAELCERNDKHLAEKWGDDFWQRQLVGYNPTEQLVLNLGCGYRKVEGAVNIDNRAEVKPDLLLNITDGLPYPDNSVDQVCAFDFIEHLERKDVLKLMDEVYRVLKPDGIFYHITPSDDARGAWQDPTHRSAWNINTWRFYFVEPEYRKLYGTKAHFKIIELEDVWTDEENKILHTRCVYQAVK